MSRIGFVFTRKMPLAYLSHLDMVRLFLRALRRSRLPLAFSRGFNPHPRLTLALPLPVGVTASEEYGEMYFTEPTRTEEFLARLRAQLPEAVELNNAFIVPPETPSLASLVGAALYRAVLKNISAPGLTVESVRNALERMLAKKEILVCRRTKKKKKVLTDVRPYIIDALVKKETGKPLELNLVLRAGSRGGVTPFILLELLESDPALEGISSCDWHLHRERIYTDDQGSLQPLSEGM